MFRLTFNLLQKNNIVVGCERRLTTFVWRNVSEVNLTCGSTRGNNLQCALVCALCVIVACISALGLGLIEPCVFTLNVDSDTERDGDNVVVGVALVDGGTCHTNLAMSDDVVYSNTRTFGNLDGCVGRFDGFNELISLDGLVESRRCVVADSRSRRNVEVRIGDKATTWLFGEHQLYANGFRLLRGIVFKSYFHFV